MKYIFFFILLLSLQISGLTQNEPKHFVGMASWYGEAWNGRKTSSGEVFNSAKLTAAHKNLAFGTVVKVTNLLNELSVYVKINDRLPQKSSRIIDLSKGAAAEIGILRSGIAKVKIELVPSFLSDLASEN